MVTEEDVGILQEAFFCVRAELRDFRGKCSVAEFSNPGVCMIAGLTFFVQDCSIFEFWIGAFINKPCP